MAQRIRIKPYWASVGGWGSARSVGEILLREGIPLEGPLTLLHQNKPLYDNSVSLFLRVSGDTFLRRLVLDTALLRDAGHARFQLFDQTLALAFAGS